MSVLRAPIFRRRSSKRVQELIGFLKESQFWSLEQLRDFQWARLKVLINHAYSNVPYYRRVFEALRIVPDDVNSLKDLQQLPLLTKTDIQQNFSNLLDSEIDRNKLLLNTTGGSTGQPLRFYQDEEYLDWTSASRTRAWKLFFGGDVHDIEAILWGAERDIGKGLSFQRIAYHVLRDGTIPLNSFDLVPSLVKRYVLAFNLLRPKLLRGYASSLYHFATFLETHSLSINPPRAIISAAELLLPHMRKKIEIVLGAPVYDSYGCREVSQIATECEAHNGLHVVMENQYVEIVDGSIVITNLHNRCMPLIRYKIGDMAQGIEETPCACGRQMVRLVGLQGRESDLIVLPNGRTVHGEYFTHLFYEIEGVKDFQVVYHRRSARIEFLLNVEKNTKDIERHILKSIIRDLNFNQIEINYAQSFAKTGTGKFKFVSSVDS